MQRFNDPVMNVLCHVHDHIFLHGTNMNRIDRSDEGKEQRQYDRQSEQNPEDPHRGRLRFLFFTLIFA